jgi:hypothetical protein
MKDCEREGGAAEVPALLQAVRATVAALETRARVYRWAVVSVALAFVVPIVLTIVSLSWRPLASVALLVPVVGAFLVVDSRIVFGWQRRVLHLWVSSDFGLSDIRQTVQAIRYLPSGTIVGMLDRLPRSDAPRDDERSSALGRASLAESSLERVRRQDRRTLLSVIGATLLAGSAAAGVSIHGAVPLLGAAVGLALLLSTRWWTGGPR